jgi:hypothetical protein
VIFVIGFLSRAHHDEHAAQTFLVFTKLFSFGDLLALGRKPLPGMRGRKLKLAGMQDLGVGHKYGVTRARLSERRLQFRSKVDGG